MLLTLALSVDLSAGPPVRTLLGQDLPAVRTAIQLAAEGRGDSARRLVEAELARARPGESAYVEALYWRARLATFGDTAERDLRRVAIEFSTSRWADDALLQLAQLAMAAGNPASALALAQRLRSDYPGSEQRSQAALWAGRAAFEVGEPRTACALLDSARVEAGNDVEFVNQIAFHSMRCAGPTLSGSPSDSASPAPVSPTPDPLATPPPRPFEIQVVAARTERAARDVAARLTRQGYQARVVAGADGFHRVRVGPYPTVEAAEAAARQVRRVVGGAPFVVRAP